MRKQIYLVQCCPRGDFRDAIFACTCCDLCCYRDWNEYVDVMASCMDVHGCTPDANTYFIAEQL